MTEQHVVIGQGLLGGAVARHLGVRWRPAIRWSDVATAEADLRGVVARIVAMTDDAWSISWCAGAGHVGSDARAMQSELALYGGFLDELDARLPHGSFARGSIFFASSAGGIHARGDGTIAREDSPPHPRSAYGAGKLAHEELTSDWALACGVRCLIGRISNLYGAHQDLRKPQGFISHLCRSILLHRSFVLTALADTTRDFIAADDAASRIGQWIGDGSSSLAEPGVVTKLLVSGRSVSLNDVIATVARVTRLHPAVVYGASSSSHLQPRHSRFRSDVLAHLDQRHPARPLEVGVTQTWASMARSNAGGRLR